MNRRLRLLLGIIISLVFLYLAVRKIDWPELAEAYRQANFLYLIPALAILIAISVARAFRWRLLMYPDRVVPVGRLFWYVNIGYLYNNILPAKVGEVVRGYLTGRDLRGGIAQGLSTLLVERLLDVLSVVVLLIALIPYVSLPTWATRGGLLFGTVAVVGVAGLVILARFGDRGLDWLWRYLSRLPLVGQPRVREILGNVLAGLHVLTEPRMLPGIIAWSAIIWLGYAAFNYTVMAAFRMTYLPFAAAAFVLVATGLGMVVPSSPGALGVFEASAVLALSVYGVGQSQAFGYALGLHLFTNLALIVLGLIGLFRESLSFSGVRRVVEQPAPAVDGSPQS